MDSSCNSRSSTPICIEGDETTVEGRELWCIDPRDAADSDDDEGCTVARPGSDTPPAALLVFAAFGLVAGLARRRVGRAHEGPQPRLGLSHPPAIAATGADH